jgi:Flp pilus assembly pilin Flp
MAPENKPSVIAPAGAWRRLAARLHRDERGGVSIETVLIIAAIALPILIFVIKFGWPRIKGFFNQGMTDLESGSTDAATTP